MSERLHTFVHSKPSGDVEIDKTTGEILGLSSAALSTLPERPALPEVKARPEVAHGAELRRGKTHSARGLTLTERVEQAKAARIGIDYQSQDDKRLTQLLPPEARKKLVGQAKSALNELGLSSVPYVGETAKSASEVEHRTQTKWELKVYRRDVERRKISALQGIQPPQLVDVTRGKITELSSRSLQRLAFVATNTEVEFSHMLTLTYPSEFPHSGNVCKRHLATMVRWIRDRLGRPFSYLWILEFQRRGAPHFHLFLKLEQGERIATKRQISTHWAKIARDELEAELGDYQSESDGYDGIKAEIEAIYQKHKNAGTRIERIKEPEGARRYCVKYATKRHQKDVPEEFQTVGRFWATSQDVLPEADTYILPSLADIAELLEPVRVVLEDDGLSMDYFGQHRTTWRSADKVREVVEQWPNRAPPALPTHTRRVWREDLDGQMQEVKDTIQIRTFEDYQLYNFEGEE